MKVLVTGAGGQLGTDLPSAFEGHEVVGLTRAQLDVTVEADVVAAVRDHSPDVVVHTAAFTAVDGAETDPLTAHRVNAIGSWWVARACDLVDATLVYISTDYVFDGSLGRAYTEFDPLSPCNAYGRSKAAGEELVRQTLQRHYVVRTSWVHGVHGTNFARTMLRLAADRPSLSVVDDQCGSPTFTFDLASALRQLVSSGRYGTYHLTNAGSCTWFEFARRIFDRAGAEVELTPTDSAAFGAPALRPPFSVLHNLQAPFAGVDVLPPWEASLDVFLKRVGAT